MMLTLAERMSLQAPAVQTRDSLDEFAALWKSNREGSAGSVDIGGSARPYGQHPWVHSCVSAIARNVSQVPFKFRDMSTQEDLPASHWLWGLFTSPNPLSSRFDLWTATETYLNLGGDCLWVSVPSASGQEIAEVWAFGRQHIEPRIQGSRFIGWRVQWMGQRDTFEPWEVLHFKYFNPYHPVLGMAPLEAARLSIDQDWWAKKYNKTFFQNFAEPGIILQAKGKLTNQQIDQMRTSFEQRHRGFNRARRTAVTQGDVTVKELGASKREMQFVQQMSMSRQEIMSVFRVPPAEVMLYESVSSRVESSGAQRRLFGEEVIAPELVMLEDRIQGWLDFHKTGAECYFDTSEVSILQESRSELIEQGAKLQRMGFTGNEINEKLGLGFEDKPWRDEWWVPQNLVPASSLSGGTPDDGGDDEPGEELEGRPPAESSPELVAPPGSASSLPEDKHYHPGPRLSAAEVRDVKRLRRWLYETRNTVLRVLESTHDGSVSAEWDGFFGNDGEGWRKLRKIVNNMAAAEIIDGITRVCMNGNDASGIIPAGKAKALFSFLRQRAPEIIRWAAALPTYSVTSTVTRDSGGSPVFEYEEWDRDRLWQEYAAFLAPFERKYAASLRNHFSSVEADYMREFDNLYRDPPSADRVAGREPGVDWKKHDESLSRRSKRHMESVVTEAGKCSRLVPSKSARAKATHVPSTRAIQQRADVSERDVASALRGGEHQKNNDPMDVIAGRHGIEVKTLTVQKNDKITMHPESLARKLEFVRKKRLRGHTVVVDARGSKPVYYYREGFGSFRLKTMEEIELGNLDEIIRRRKQRDV